MSRRTKSSGIEVQPNPPLAGQGAEISLPGGGEWHAYLTDSQGNVTDLGPFQVGADGKLDIPIPASAEGSTLTITDEGEPVPTDASFPVVAND
jgi:hypothetical protein